LPIDIPFRPPRRVLGLAGLTLLALGLGSGFPAAQSVERQVVQGTSVAIYDLAGQVTVEPATGGDVVVEVTRGGADAARLRVEQGAVAGWQTLRVVFPANRVVYRQPGAWGTDVDVSDDGRFDDQKLLHLETARHRVQISGRGTGLDAHADLRVRVPAGRSLALFLAVGEATITNVDGELRVSVASAGLTTRNTRGSLAVESGSGQLRVRDAVGRVTLDSGSGGMDVRGVRGPLLQLDSGSGGVTARDVEVDELKGDTGSGGIELEEVRAPVIALDTGSGGVRISLGSGPLRSLVIDSGSGGVTLAVPRGIGATFDVEHGSGDVDIQVPHQVREMTRDHVRGTLGDGSGRIHVETGSGSVRITPRAASGARSQGGIGLLIGHAFA
jgi:lia operon protein LiaG